MAPLSQTQLCSGSPGSGALYRAPVPGMTDATRTRKGKDKGTQVLSKRDCSKPGQWEVVLLTGCRAPLKQHLGCLPWPWPAWPSGSCILGVLYGQGGISGSGCNPVPALLSSGFSSGSPSLGLKI